MMRQRMSPSMGTSRVATTPQRVAPIGHHPSIAESTFPRIRRGENSLTSA